jgi:3-deoxy-manno-octulosonate cytidylyltransferase (CMP-KDO synthetase)
LLRETGKYLVQHVYERARHARRIDEVLVATDDERIAEAVRRFGGEVVMTAPELPSGTDRVAAVARAREVAADGLVLNIQGDEPEVDPAGLDRLVEAMQADRDCQMGTIASPFPERLNAANPNFVKVVIDSAGFAIYFSRALIPFPRDSGGAAAATGTLLHLGVYAYRRGFLDEFASWPPGRLEQIEKLEQLRVVERGLRIRVAIAEHGSVGIDTPADYEAFVSRWRIATGFA